MFISCLCGNNFGELKGNKFSNSSTVRVEILSDGKVQVSCCECERRFLISPRENMKVEVIDNQSKSPEIVEEKPPIVNEERPRKRFKKRLQ